MTYVQHNFIKTGLLVLAMLMSALLLTGVFTDEARAEYGDVVLNNYAEAANMRPVVFPHWFHRIRFRCKVCHGDLGFKFKAGGNEINMAKIIEGEYCGACHNGEISWSIEECDLCHSGKMGMPTQVHGNTIKRLPKPANQKANTSSKAK